MPKPLVSQDPKPRDIQFTHFGVLNTGAQSKTSLFTSITVNALLALIIVIVGAAARKAVVDNRTKEAIYPVEIKAKPPEPPKPPPVKIIPPKPIPKPIEPPKIKLPDVKIPDPPKPVEVKVAPPTPVKVMTPAPPKVVVAAAAPKPVNINLGQSASVVNHDAHPAPVALGSATNPIAPSNRPAVASAVNLGNRGLSGMPPGNTGGGPPSSKVNLGSGQPNGGINGTGSRAVAGVVNGIPHGTPGATGNSNGTQAPQVVALGHPPAPPPTPGVTLPRLPATRLR